LSFTISLPFLYHFTGREGSVKTYHDRLESEGGNLTHTKAIFQEGGYQPGAGGEHKLITEREAIVASRRVSTTGEQFLCRGRAVSYQREEEQQRQENQVLPHKVATFPVCFKSVSNWRGGEFYL